MSTHPSGEFGAAYRHLRDPGEPGLISCNPSCGPGHEMLTNRTSGLERPFPNVSLCERLHPWRQKLSEFPRPANTVSNGASFSEGDMKLSVQLEFLSECSYSTRRAPFASALISKAALMELASASPAASQSTTR